MQYLQSLYQPSADEWLGIYSELRSQSYFPDVVAPRREMHLHPVLTSAQDLDPIDTDQQNYIGLHPAIANAQPLARSSSSSPAVRGKSRDFRGRMQELLFPSTTDTCSNVSIEERSPASVFLEDFDLQTASETQDRSTDPNSGADSSTDTTAISEYTDCSNKKDDCEEIEAFESEPQGSASTMQEMIDLVEHEIHALRTEDRQRNHRPRRSAARDKPEPEPAVVADARACIEAFEASPAYLAYQDDQESLLLDRVDKAARQRIFSFRRTAKWRQYVDDLVLVLRHDCLTRGY